MRRAWSWPGAVALVVAFFVAGGWAVALVISALPITETITAGGANLLATVGGVLAGGVAAYIGAVARTVAEGQFRDRGPLEIDTPETGDHPVR